MPRPKVYISGPITSSGEFYGNIASGIKVWRLLVAGGYAPYCPHLYDLGYMVVGSPIPYEELMAMDLSWVAASDALLRLPGLSKGADREVECAIRLKIPVFYSVQELNKHFFKFEPHEGGEGQTV